MVRRTERTEQAAQLSSEAVAAVNSHRVGGQLLRAVSSSSEGCTAEIILLTRIICLQVMDIHTMKHN